MRKKRGIGELDGVENIAKIVMFSLLASIMIIGVFSARGLFADGSYFMFQMLQRKGFFVFDEPRIFAQIITQAPVVMAMRAGIDNMSVLIRLQSFGLIGIPLLLWVSALLISFWSEWFWYFCLAFAVTYLTAGFFSVGEYNLAYAAVALAAAILLGERIGFWRLLTLLSMAFLLTRSYEAMVFLGPLLFAMSIYRAHIDEELPISARGGLVLAAFLFAVAAAIAGWSILFPRDPVNLAGAEDLMAVVEQKFFIWVAVEVVVSAILLLNVRVRVTWVFLVVGVVFDALLLFRVGWTSSPDGNYKFRAVAGLLLFVVLAWMAAVSILPWKRGVGIRLGALNVFLLTISLSVSFFQYNFGFMGWVGRLDRVALKIHHDVPMKDTAIDDRGSLYDWGWTDPWLTAILKGGGKGVVLSYSNFWNKQFLSECRGGCLGSYKKPGSVY